MIFNLTNLIKEDRAMKCVKCECQLTVKEVNVGKEKCVTCLVKGYKFAFGGMFRQRDSLVETLRFVLQDKNSKLDPETVMIIDNEIKRAEQ